MSIVDPQDPNDLEFQILNEIIRAEFDPQTRSGDLRGDAFAALVSKPFKNVCNSTRWQIAGLLNRSGLRMWRTCYRPTTAGDLAVVTQQTDRITLVTDDAPWVPFCMDLRVDRPLSGTHPVLRGNGWPGGGLSMVVKMQAGLDPDDPYVKRVIAYYSPMLGQVRPDPIW